jgi:hypothetical protein
MAYPGVNSISPKDPLDVCAYSFNWSNWLGAGETITSANVTVATGITLYSTPVINGSVVSFYLSGGANGMAYQISCLIQTDLPDAANRSFLLQVKNL